MVWQIKKLERNLVRGKLRLTGAGNRLTPNGNEEVFTANADATALRVMALVAAMKKWGLSTADIATAFLLAELGDDEKVIVQVPSILHQLGLVRTDIKG